MSKEVLSAQRYRSVSLPVLDDAFALTEQQQRDLAQLYASAPADFKQGALVSGKIVSISPNGVLVDIGFKTEGLIPLYEFSELEMKKLGVGSPLEVIIEEIEGLNGGLVLSYEKAKAHKAWATIMKLFEENKPVEGIVTHKVKGGLNVDIGVPAFLPGSQVDVQRVADFDIFLKQPITAYIIKVNQKRGNVIISRRKFLSEQRADSRKKVMDTIHVNDVIQGVVKNITNYGAFVDIGGVDGLLHITDMTWGRIAHPSEVLKIGDTVTVKVLTLDATNEKISLGMKQLLGNPWEQLSKDIVVGSVVKGTISSIADYGLFVNIAPGVEGLIHISEISWTERISDLHRHYRVGDSIEALVVSIDKENRRISLSIKQLGKNPWDLVSEQLKVGQRVKGVISNVADFGIFVQIMPGIDGLVHISDLSWTEHIKHPSDLYKKGDTVEALVTDINVAKKKISLGIKQLVENPWDRIEERYPVNSFTEGEVTKITDFGAFVKLADGIEGLMHVSEVSDANEPISSVLQVGQKMKFRVIKVSKEEQKLGLSLKSESASRGERRAPAQKRGERSGSTQSRSKSHESAPVNTVFGEKLKSQLQLELEKHAHRTNKNSSEDDAS